MTDTLKQAGSEVQVAGDSATGSDQWSKMSEEQKKQTFHALPDEKKKGKTYSEWIKEGYQQTYQRQKETWVPWMEDLYLRWFTNDNKASYATKDTLGKTKVTGVEQIDNLQDGVNNVVAGQVGQGGLLQPAGDVVSKEGVNRAERGGKDNDGTYGAPAAGATESTVRTAKSAGEGVSSSAKSAGGYVSGFFGGGSKNEK